MNEKVSVVPDRATEGEAMVIEPLLYWALTAPTAGVPPVPGGTVMVIGWRAMAVVTVKP